jgi:hypothetical protein
MPRTVRLDLAVDTSFYTALQLQPRVLLAQSFSALASWYRSNLVATPVLRQRHADLGHGHGRHLAIIKQRPGDAEAS